MPCRSGRSTNDGSAGTKSFGRTNCSALKKIFRRFVVRNATRKADPEPNRRPINPRILPRRPIQKEKTVYTKDAIRFSLNLAVQAMFKSLAEIEDLPLTFPTEEGGCHPLWVLGHLTLSLIH